MERNLSILPFENDNRYDDDNIFIDDASITYCQSSDCSGEDGEESVQQITITTRNNGCARFINIKTDSWSISDISELKKIIEDFEKRVLLKND